MWHRLFDIRPRASFGLAPVLAGALWVAAPAPSPACTCTEYPTFEEAYAGSSAIFRGVVRWIDPLDDWTSIVGFEAAATWRGPLGPSISVFTPASEASCGYTFVIGEEYLVYAIGTWNDIPAVYLCWRTHPAYRGDPDLVRLGPPRPLAVEPATWTLVKRLFE